MICKNFHQLLHFNFFLILFELILNSFNSLNISSLIEKICLHISNIFLLEN